MLWSGGFQWLSVNVRGQTVPGHAPGQAPGNAPATCPARCPATRHAGCPARARAQKCPRFLRQSQEPGALFAEGKRFELLVRGYRTLVFKTSSIGRSDNLP
jgi:hypothetical protein